MTSLAGQRKPAVAAQPATTSRARTDSDAGGVAGA
jgi:hypothetical protein